ncbi:TKL protein kinase [Saprolegnia diclina VS20]|uniref:TKL protein kinase n=1 Tax=Saprolegnia diclina (strain VS20) TaxID=1156394 RepID=T0RRB8_SAPDV|nr:TKL protein kinase [Saprolegnia diclina VS20]EQC34963.1 TKL protein kinase [Saprolegnia diclina VS20]|eukprot:XP_008611835.1 TKL protein kinase [Saprolegnia diclina VS20]
MMPARVGVWVLGTDRSYRRLVLYVAFSYMALILLHAIALGLWLFWLAMMLLLQLLLWPCQPSWTFFRDFVRENVCSGYLEWLCRWDVRVRNVYAVKLYIEPTLPVDLETHVGRVFAYFLFWKSLEFGIAALTLFLIQLPFSTCQPYDYEYDTATRKFVAVTRECHYAERGIALLLPVLLFLRLVAWCSVRMCELCIAPIFRPSLATYQSLVDTNEPDDAPLRLRPTAPRGEDTLGITTVAYPTNTYCIPVPQHAPKPAATPVPLLESPPSKPARASACRPFGLHRRRTSDEATTEMPRPNRKVSDSDELSAADMTMQHLSQPLSLVTEYLPFGSLEDQRSQLSAAQKQQIIKGAASGFLNMHEGRFIHRDIAARNCLVDASLNAKVCDFGMCRRVGAVGGSYFAHGTGPLKYMAPESLTPPHAFSYQSDVYSFGVLIWETYHGVSPFVGLSGAEAAARVLSGDRLALSEAIPLHLQELVTQCFRDDPSKRPSMAQVLLALD